MSTLAKIVPKARGYYYRTVPPTVYNSLDIVRHNRKSWMCILDGTVNIDPSESASNNWMLLNEDGTGSISMGTIGTNYINSDNITVTVRWDSLQTDGYNEYVLNGTCYQEQTQTLSTSTNTVFKFESAIGDTTMGTPITTDSCIDVYTSTGMFYESMVIEKDVIAGIVSCTITYPKVDTAVSMKCKIYIRK